MPATNTFSAPAGRRSSPFNSLRPGRRRQAIQHRQDLCNHSGEPPGPPIRSNPLLRQCSGPLRPSPRALSWLVRQLGAPIRLCSEPGSAVLCRPANSQASRRWAFGEGRVNWGPQPASCTHRFAQAPRPAQAAVAVIESSRLERCSTVECPQAELESRLPRRRVCPSEPPTPAWRPARHLPGPGILNQRRRQPGAVPVSEGGGRRHEQPPGIKPDCAGGLRQRLPGRGGPRCYAANAVVRAGPSQAGSRKGFAEELPRCAQLGVRSARSRGVAAEHAPEASASPGRRPQARAAAANPS